MILETILGKGKTSDLYKGQAIKNLKSSIPEATAMSSREVHDLFLNMYVCTCVCIVISSSCVRSMGIGSTCKNGHGFGRKVFQ